MRYLLAGVLSLALASAFATSAAAHAYLDHAQPAEGEELAAPPTVVKLWFSRAIEPAFSSIRVLDAQGKRVDGGAPVVSDDEPKLIQVELSSLQPGTYRVVWHIVALDGHKAKGEFSFIVK